MNTRNRTVAVVLVIGMLGVIAATTAFSAGQPIAVPKGSSAHRLDAGHVVFVLPDGGKVEVRGLDIKTGGFVAIEVRDPKGRLVRSGRAGRLVRSRSLTRAQALKLRPRDYVAIDDEPTWLPLILRFEDVNELSPQPDPPGSAGRNNPSLPTVAPAQPSPGASAMHRPFAPKAVETQPLTMAGMRFEPKTVATAPLTMSGLRFEPMTLTTGTLTMTGLR